MKPNDIFYNFLSFLPIVFLSVTTVYTKWSDKKIKITFLITCALLFSLGLIIGFDLWIGKTIILILLLLLVDFLHVLLIKKWKL